MAQDSPSLLKVAGDGGMSSIFTIPAGEADFCVQYIAAMD